MSLSSAYSLAVLNLPFLTGILARRKGRDQAGVLRPVPQVLTAPERGHAAREEVGARYPHLDSGTWIHTR